MSKTENQIMQILRLLECNVKNSDKPVNLQHYVDLIESVYDFKSEWKREYEAIWVVDKKSQPSYQSPSVGNPNQYDGTTTCENVDLLSKIRNNIPITMNDIEDYWLKEKGKLNYEYSR